MSQGSRVAVLFDFHNKFLYNIYIYKVRKNQTFYRKIKYEEAIKMPNNTFPN